MQYHAEPCNTVPYGEAPRHVPPCCATQHHLVPHCAILCHVKRHRAVPCSIVPCHAVSCRAEQCCAVPCVTTLRHAEPCCAAPRCAVPCRAVSGRALRRPAVHPCPLAVPPPAAPGADVPLEGFNPRTHPRVVPYGDIVDSKVISWALQLPRALRWTKRAEEKGGSTAGTTDGAELLPASSCSESCAHIIITFHIKAGNWTNAALDGCCC